MTTLAYIFFALSFLQFIVSIITGLMKAFKIPIKRHYLVFSNHSTSAYLGLLGSISLLYLINPSILQADGMEGVVVKLCIVLMLISLVSYSIGYFVDRKREAKSKYGVE